MKISLIEYPSEAEWKEVKRRALITQYGKGIYALKNECQIEPPKWEWRKRILNARHSPIRYLRFAFQLEDVPGNVATHLARHVHAQPYISSLRNDRQNAMDGDTAPRNTPVNMILDVNAEELMTIANKRLCKKAAKMTREVVTEMCKLAEKAMPELEGYLVPMCQYHGGECKEMHPCFEEK